MNKFLACTFIAVILGVVLWWQLRESQQEISEENAAAPVTQEAPPQSAELIERMPFVDEAIEEMEALEQPWEYHPEVGERFRQAYAKSEAVLDAEAEILAYIKRLTLERKAQNQWQRIAETMELLEQSGMAVSPFAGSTFQDVLIFAYHPIANKLGRQLKEFRQWESDRQNRAYQDQLSRLRDYPLDFPPEKHFIAFRRMYEEKAIPPEALIEAAEFRDQILLLHGELLQAKAVMEAGILAVISELDISVPYYQREQAFADLLPAYAAHLQAEEELGTRYAVGLLAILAGHDGL